MSEICRCGHPRTIREGVCLCLDYASEDHFTPHRAPETAPGPGANRTDHPTPKEHPHGQQGHEARRTEGDAPRCVPPTHEAGPEGPGRAQRAPWSGRTPEVATDFNTSPAAQNTTHGHSEARDTFPVARPATPAHLDPPAGARATRDDLIYQPTGAPPWPSPRTQSDRPRAQRTRTTSRGQSRGPRLLPASATRSIDTASAASSSPSVRDPERRS